MTQCAHSKAFRLCSIIRPAQAVRIIYHWFAKTAFVLFGLNAAIKDGLGAAYFKVSRMEATNMGKKFTTIDEYIADATPEVRGVLQEIRDIVKRLVPSANETISYQMPAFKLERVFFYFAAFKKHIGVYPPVKGDRQLQRDLHRYRGEKGNLRFPLSEQIPYELIGRVALTLSREHSRR